MSNDQTSVPRGPKAIALAPHVAVTGAGVLALILASDYGWWTDGRVGPGLLPGIAALVLTVVGLLQLLGAHRRVPQTRLSQPAGLRKPLVVLLVAGALIFLSPYIGFLPAAGLAMAFLFRWVEHVSIVKSLVLSMCATLALWALFVVALGIPLPEFGSGR